MTHIAIQEFLDRQNDFFHLKPNIKPGCSRGNQTRDWAKRSGRTS